MIDLALRKLILDSATAVTDLVAADEATSSELRGVYAGEVPPRAERPYVLITALRDVARGTLDGGDAFGAGTLRTADVDFDCVADRRLVADRLRRALEAFLDGLSLPTTLTLDERTVTIRQLGDEDFFVVSDSYEPRRDGEESGRHVTTLNGPVFHTVST